MGKVILRASPHGGVPTAKRHSTSCRGRLRPLHLTSPTPTPTSSPTPFHTSSPTPPPTTVSPSPTHSAAPTSSPSPYPFNYPTVFCKLKRARGTPKTQRPPYIIVGEDKIDRVPFLCILHLIELCCCCFQKLALTVGICLIPPPPQKKFFFVCVWVILTYFSSVAK